MQDIEDGSAGHDTDESQDPSSAVRRIKARSGNDAVTERKTKYSEEREQRRERRLAYSAFVISIIALIVPIICIPLSIYWPSWFSPEGDIRGVIEKEAELTLARDLDGVVELYTSDAKIRDEAGGQGEAKTWIGLQEIRERYDQLVPFTALSHDDIIIMISTDGKYATATSSTLGKYCLNGECTVISGYSSNRDEEWTLEKVDGKWKIRRFTYNLP